MNTNSLPQTPLMRAELGKGQSVSISADVGTYGGQRTTGIRLIFVSQDRIVTNATVAVGGWRRARWAELTAESVSSQGVHST